MDDKKRKKISKAILETMSPEIYEEIKSTLEDFQNKLTDYAYSFKNERELLEYAKYLTIKFLENPDLIMEELEKKDPITYEDIELYLRCSPDLKFLVLACKMRSWGTKQLSYLIKEQLISFYPNENVTFDLEEEAKEDHILETAKELISYTSSSSLASGNYVFPIDPISRSITKLEVSNETEITNKIDVTGKKDKKKGTEDIITYVTLKNELYDDLGITNINDFDTAVMEAIITEWENKETRTTPQQLFRIMTKNFNSRITEEKEEQILESLKKLRTYNIKINANEEAKYYPSLKLKSLEGTLISTSVFKGIYNNKEATLISIELKYSPLYIYAKEKKQLCSVPFNLLTTNEVNKNAETIKLERFLISRIESIPRLSNKITLETIFKETGIEEACTNATKRQRTIKKINGLLDGYIKTGYIKGYTVNKKGRAQHSITIIK